MHTFIYIFLSLHLSDRWPITYMYVINTKILSASSIDHFYNTESGFKQYSIQIFAHRHMYTMTIYSGSDSTEIIGSVILPEE